MSQTAPMRNVTVLLLVNNYGEFLLGKRKEGKFAAGFWELPGGKQEEGEDLLSCLQREIAEEIGYTVNKREVALIHHVQVPYSIGEIPLYVFGAHLDTAKLTPAVVADSEDLNRPLFPALEHETLRWVDGLAAQELPLLPIMRQMLDLPTFRERISNISVVDTACDRDIKI